MAEKRVDDAFDGPAGASRALQVALERVSMVLAQFLPSSHRQLRRGEAAVSLPRPQGTTELG
eukprot:12910356-Prorocentrum_lima.AAC.1